ncbi:tRNA1(Val) (adenine(37)-N6)-methyltransferase [Hydrogenimonas sp.]
MFLYDFVASFSPRGNLLDVGCGVGVIGLLLARDFPVRLTLVEKQEKMAFLAKRNMVANRIEAKLIHGDFLSFESEKRFDFIVSNPPFYHPDVVRSEDEHIRICRYNDHLPVGAFFGKVKSLLAPRGRFVFCYDATQVGDLFLHLADVNLRVEDMRFVHPKKDRPAKLVLVHARNNSRARTKIRPPFVVFEGETYGPEAEAVFKKARTHTLKCRI